MKTRKKLNSLGVKLAVQYMNESIVNEDVFSKLAPAKMEKLLKDREKELKTLRRPVTIRSMTSMWQLENTPHDVYQSYLQLLKKMYPNMPY
jgi:hypothetical protein